MSTGARPAAPGEVLDRVMFWVVGALLVALNAALAVLQARPPW
jgi:hypothetical protein